MSFTQGEKANFGGTYFHSPSGIKFKVCVKTSSNGLGSHLADDIVENQFVTTATSLLGMRIRPGLVVQSHVRLRGSVDSSTSSPTASALPVALPVCLSFLGCAVAGSDE